MECERENNHEGAREEMKTGCEGDKENRKDRECGKIMRERRENRKLNVKVRGKIR